ncbi:hypothetical protein O1611_g4600 [Lasiodiplodia mahajangana]|uniref:Uncharacterized protein n=1 Tax=Lasiodiplodia mahajangana TaxID=1108764 RepID=A0ACC2JNV5_9PEZI|nr:hypothetical protein O1611_g4600 [Lasiodiplodia mahajangana]
MASNNWERHKGIITHLYLNERMKLDQVVSYMREEHNFEKCKSSYEIRLKKWGIRKNMRQKDWQNIPNQVNEGLPRQSVVTLCGMPLPHEKVRKEIQRYMHIPSADDFRNGRSGPNTPLSTSIGIQALPTIELDISWPETLPFFSFKNRVLLTLQNPRRLLRAFFDTGFQYEGSSREPIYVAWKNPSELHQAVLRLSNAVPNDVTDRRRKAAALARNQFPPCLVTEMLKIVFFRLSNNMDKYYVPRYQRIHDQFVFHLARAVSRSNPEMLPALFSGKDATTNAIKEAVYGCAIRERNYEFVELLLKSGVDPNLPVKTDRVLSCDFERGVINLKWSMLSTMATGIQEAAIGLDSRLAEMLLNAGANVNNGTQPMVFAAMSEKRAHSSNVLDFMQLLVRHGATINPLVSWCRDGHVHEDKSALFALAIADKNPRLMEFLVENGATADLSAYSQVTSCRRGHSTTGSWYCMPFTLLNIPYNYIQLAVVFGNSDIVERLLQQVLSLPLKTAQETIKPLLLTSCLVGDLAVASRLLQLEGIHLDLNNGWELGITPLVASSWNPETSIAEMLLDLGATVGPTRQDEVLLTSTFCPIHIASYHGNVMLVQQLINRGADLNVCYRVRKLDRFGYPNLDWLAPRSLSTPLQFALESQNAETIILLLSHLNMFDGDSGDTNALISDLTAEKPSMPNDTIFNGTPCAAAIKAGSEEIVRFYFSSGGYYTSTALHLATFAALGSKNYSMFKLIAKHRDRGRIDRHEASCLVLAIVRCLWDLVDLLLCEPFLAGPSQSLYQCKDFDNLRDYDFKSLIDYHHWEGWAGITPLSAAMLSGNAGIVEAMIQRGFIPQGSDVRVLLEDEVPDTIRTTVWSKFPLESMDFNCRRAAFEFAIATGDTIKVREIMGTFPSLDFWVFEDEDERRTPIVLAAALGHMEMVRLFYDNGADPYLIFSNPESRVCSRRSAIRGDEILDGTALKVAAFRGHLDIVEMLLNQTDTDMPTRMRNAIEALQTASGLGNINIVRWLINWGVDINAVATRQLPITPLESAAANGRLDTVQFLLENGATVDGPMRMHYVRSIYFATKLGHFAVADHLRKYGSWAETDYSLYCRFDTYDHMFLMRFSVYSRLRHWFGKVKRLSDDYPWNIYSNSSVEERDIGENGSRGGTEITDRYKETNERPLSSLSNTELTLTSRGNLNFLESPRALGAMRAITENENIFEASDTTQQTTIILSTLGNDCEVPTIGTHRNIRDTRMKGNHGTDFTGELGDVGTTINETSFFDLGRYIPEMDFQGEQDAFFSSEETEFERRFIDISEHGISDSNALGVIPVEGVPNVDIGYVDAVDMQNILLGSVDEGWQGPFTNYDGA